MEQITKITYPCNVIGKSPKRIPAFNILLDCLFTRCYVSRTPELTIPSTGAVMLFTCYVEIMECQHYYSETINICQPVNNRYGNVPRIEYTNA